MRDANGAAVAVGRVVLFSPDRADWVRPVTRRYRDVSLKGDGTFVSTGLPAGSYLAVLLPQSGRDGLGRSGLHRDTPPVCDTVHDQ